MFQTDEASARIPTRWQRTIATLGLAFGLSGIAAAQLQLPATQDNWVNRKEPNDTHPTQTTLAMRGPATRSDAKEVFIRFEVPSGAITKAELSLYRHNITGSNTVEIAAVATTADIDTVTWNTRPTTATVLLTVPIASGSGSEIYDLTGFVLPGQQLTLRLRLLSGENTWGWGWFYSREHTSTSDRPYLFITGNMGPGYAYCCADNSSCNTCPCGNNNDGSAGCSGCASGSSAAGAGLSGSGTASLSDDTLYLHGVRGTPSNSSLFFQGQNPLDCTALYLGDGLRCAGGYLIRLQVKLNDAAGNASTSIVISQKSAAAGDVILPGTMRYYQWWYRDTMNPPCGTGVNDSNSSNGYAVFWLP